MKRSASLSRCQQISFLLGLAIVVLTILFLPSTFAQGGSGAISGRVVDSSGAILKGAEIAVSPNGTSVTSDAQGQFLMTGLAPGDYTLTVSYVGFNTFTKSVAIAAGQTVGIEAKLDVESQKLSVLVSAGRASGEAEEVNRQRSADNVVQVLTSDVINSLPNANMADALGRLPSVTIERDEGEGKYVQIRGTEPRLSNVTIDGVNVPSPESGVRQIKLDAIPADIVESVEINKTLQANMDGDGIGGSVNLVTRTAGERPTLSISEIGGYTPILNGRGLTETAWTVGQRFGAQKRFGILIGGSYDWNGRGIDDIEPVPDLNAQGGRVFDSMDIREYRYYRSRWGLAGSTDYRLSDTSSIYLRGLYSDFKNYGDRWVYSLNDGAPPSFNTQLRRPDYAIGSLALGGRHILSKTFYSWELSVARSSQTGQVGDRNASFDATGLATSNCHFDAAGTTSVYLPQWTPACYTEAYNPANYTLSDVSVSHGLSAQLNLQGGASMGRSYHFGSHNALIEIGGKFRNEHKFDNTFKTTYTPAAPISLSAFPSRFSNSNYYQGAYKLGPNPSFDDIFAYVNSHSVTVSDDSAGNPSNYDLIEKVSAGYLMNTIDFGRFRFIAGVRFEGTQLGTRVPVIDGSGVPTGFSQASGSYVTVLPSASLRYAFTSSTNLRLAYSRGISRPDPQDIAQGEVIDRSAPITSVSLGNPRLKAEMADNIDVLVEHYLNPFGMVSAGFFYKNLSDPIVSHDCGPSASCVFPGANPGEVASVTQAVNAGSAWLTGFEIAYLQHLSFFPGKLRGLGVSANYSYTNSRANLGPDRTDHPRLLRDAPNTWNLSPTYDLGRFSMRLGLSYNGANIAGYQFSTGAAGGLTGPFGDNYFYSHLQVDAQGSARMGHGLTLIVYGLNLNNEVFGFYNGSPQYMVQREYYRPTIAAGLRWELGEAR